MDGVQKNRIGLVQCHVDLGGGKYNYDNNRVMST